MDFQELVRTRRSVRKFNTEKLSDEDLEKILAAGRLAPSGKNLRPVELIVVENKDTIAKLAKAKSSGAAFLAGAACAVVVIADSERSDTWIEDGSVAMIAMQFAAAELNVGSCWVQCRGRYAGEGEEAVGAEGCVRALLRFPENFSLLAVLALGYSDDMPRPRGLEETAEDKVHREIYGQVRSGCV